MKFQNNYPGISSLALKYKSLVNRDASIEKSFKWANKHYDDYFEHSRGQQIVENNIKYVEKELTFMGFVPADEFPIREGRAYIITNREFSGRYLVYPVHFSFDYKQIEKGKHPYIFNISKYIGVPGFTKILEPNDPMRKIL